MKSKTALALCAIFLLLGAVLRLYLGTQKVYLHMDESYSYGLMNDSVLSITDRPDFYGAHPDRQYYLSYLSIEGSEWEDWSPVWENQARDNHPPLYYLLLRGAASLAGGVYTKWSGLLLNLQIASCSGLLLYRLGRAISGSRAAGCLACLFETFSFLSLEMSLFIRMYELANLAVLLLYCVHLPWLLPQPAALGGVRLEPAVRAVQAPKPPAVLSHFACAGAFFLAAMTHYYCLLFALILWLWTTVRLLRQGKRRECLLYQLCPFVAALLFLCLFPAAWGHIFGGYRGLGGGDGSAVSFSLLWDRIRLWDQSSLQGTAGLLFPPFFFLMVRRRTNRTLLLLALPLAFYLLAVGLQAPYTESRYLMPACGVTCLLAALTLWGTFQELFPGKSGTAAASVLLSLILLLPVLTGLSLPTLYRQYQDVAEKAHSQRPDMIYLFQPEHNRFLDDLILFTQSGQSYIMKEEEISDLPRLCQDLGNTVWIFWGNDQDAAPVEQLPGWEVTGVKQMNACRIFFCQRTAAAAP